MHFKFNFILNSQKGRDFRLMSASSTALLSLRMQVGEGKAEPCYFVSSHTEQRQFLIQRVKHCRKIKRRWFLNTWFSTTSSHAHLGNTGGKLPGNQLEVVGWRLGRGETQKLRHFQLKASPAGQGLHKRGRSDRLKNLPSQFSSFHIGTSLPKNINWQLLTITWICQYQASFF